MKKIKVKVTAEQRVKYSKVIELTQEEFESMRAAINSDQYSGLEKWLDGVFDDSDIEDSHELEDAEFEVVEEEPKKRKGRAA